MKRIREKKKTGGRGKIEKWELMVNKKRKVKKERKICQRKNK